jgi:T6SS, Phospholipase effector Tle1-like, catalytic domain
MTMTGAPSEKAANQAAHDEPPAARPARNIVLLSDGTGNSAAKLNKTNVWRLYQALDLSGDDQIAFYDDGVGTSGIRPLRLLGGAFGWGLSRNVRALYEFLCRHYREGDHIYLFGFSRGAFTVRTLAALIAKCGVLDGSKTVPGRRRRSLQLNTHEGLKVGVRLAYRSYRRGYKAPVAQAWRWLRDRFAAPVLTPDEFRSRYSFGDVTIAFIGVWDTVDAVGLPVDELSTMIDHIFYPHRFPDQDLSPRVQRACHAIAIDDERHTFHPVLWNECGTADSGRITQVWFAGMHSNGGGGYPDDDLACVPLQWMLVEAERSGLRFDLDSLRDIAHRAQPLGRMYDSRRGFGVYYRYNPRHMASLCADRDNGVLITEPKIHAAVFERIAENTTGYAPAGLPNRYAVVGDQGQTRQVELAPQRAELLDRAQDHIFWRRVLYYLFVLVTLALVLMPYEWPAIPGGEADNPLQTGLSWTFGLLPWVLPGVVGSWAGWWTDAWTQSAGWFVVLALLYGVLLWHSRTVDANARRLSELAWWPIKRCPKPRPPTPDVGAFEGLAGKLRHIG